MDFWVYEFIFFHNIGPCMLSTHGHKCLNTATGLTPGRGARETILLQPNSELCHWENRSMAWLHSSPTPFLSHEPPYGMHNFKHHHEARTRIWQSLRRNSAVILLKQSEWWLQLQERRLSSKERRLAVLGNLPDSKREQLKASPSPALTVCG